jgi:hypothetical protein
MDHFGDLFGRGEGTRWTNESIGDRRVEANLVFPAGTRSKDLATAQRVQNVRLNAPLPIWHRLPCQVALEGCRPLAPVAALF